MLNLIFFGLDPVFWIFYDGCHFGFVYRNPSNEIICCSAGFILLSSELE
jgi:hypothetical protein